eukprot:s6440_g6.t1
MIRRSLRLPLADEDLPCPLWSWTGSATMRWSVPAGATGSSATIAFVPCWPAAKAAGLKPEVEKPGLLPPRLDAQGATGWWPKARRRLGRQLGRSPWLQPSRTPDSRLGTTRPASAHLNTQTLCAAEGLQFVPLVDKAAGGWAPAALRTWKELGELLSARAGDPADETTKQLLQALAVTLQRENAARSASPPGPA